MYPIELKRLPVDIVDILNSLIGLGPFRGNEVCAKVMNLIDTSIDRTLVIIDLRRIIWLNTAFCQPAFGPIFEGLKNGQWPRKYLLFKMNDYHKPGFFQGVLKHVGVDVPRKDAEAKFILKGMYAKLMIGSEDSIRFIGELNESELTVLDVINDLNEADANMIVQRSNLGLESVVDTLRSLIGKYFIVEYSEKDAQGFKYYSFNNYLKS